MKGSHSIEVDLTFSISYFLPGLRCYEGMKVSHYQSGLDLFYFLFFAWTKVLWRSHSIKWTWPIFAYEYFFYVQKKILSTSYLYFLYTIGVPDFTWDFGSSRMASDLLTYNYLDPSYFFRWGKGVWPFRIFSIISKKLAHSYRGWSDLSEDWNVIFCFHAKHVHRLKESTYSTRSWTSIYIGIVRIPWTDNLCGPWCRSKIYM